MSTEYPSNSSMLTDGVTMPVVVKSNVFFSVIKIGINN